MCRKCGPHSLVLPGAPLVQWHRNMEFVVGSCLTQSFCCKKCRTLNAQSRVASVWSPPPPERRISIRTIRETASIFINARRSLISMLCYHVNGIDSVSGYNLVERQESFTAESALNEVLPAYSAQSTRQSSRRPAFTRHVAPVEASRIFSAIRAAGLAEHVRR